MSTQTSGITGASVPNISSSLTQTTATTGAPTQSVSDQFMKLFIAQLQNQDPLSPQDSSAFLAQLAQMSQLEQTTQTNKDLQALTDAQAAANRAQLADMVGHKVTASGDSLEVRDPGPLSATSPAITAHTDVASKSLELDIQDASGKTLKSIDLGAHQAGDISIDPTKLGSLPAGSIKLVVKGKSLDGSDITGSTTVSGTIDAMQISDGGGRFRIGPFNVSPANITSVGASTP